jgi:hypothetical protein
MDTFIEEMNGLATCNSFRRVEAANRLLDRIQQTSHTSLILEDKPTTHPEEDYSETPPWQKPKLLLSEAWQKKQHHGTISQPQGKSGFEPTVEELRDIAAQLQDTPVKTPTPTSKSSSSLSIDDIIRKHASASPDVFGFKQSIASATVPNISADNVSSITTNISPMGRPCSPFATVSSVTTPISTKEIQRGKGQDSGSGALAAVQSAERVAKTLGGVRKKKSSTLANMFSRTNSTPLPSIPPCDGACGGTMPPRKSILSRSTPGNQFEERRKESLAAYLKSYRLTRIITLQRGPRAGQQLSVADVGSADGYPVLIFLGLGCVRYLVALFDEIATAHNLRLICIDRWGLGRSTDVPQSRRGLWEWARVVEEVMDQMQVRRFGMLAHSAGAPYAMATSLHMPDRVLGRIHLLCPWAEVEAGGSESGM